MASRLTAPRGDNALETYQQVLTLDLGNVRGRDGLETITKHYHALAQDPQRGAIPKPRWRSSMKGQKCSPRTTD